MAKVVKFAKTIRRNWKKSVFLFGIVTYGSSYGMERYKTFEMMRAYCEEAKKYGESSLPQMRKPKHVTVILNPDANDKKCNVQFEKFAAPLLHLAGFKVSVFQTEKEKQAVELMQVMSNTDAVIIAGGNGTVHEVVTGLLSRPDIQSLHLPLGVIPLGKTNTVAKHLFGSKSYSHPQLIAESVMSVIKNQTVSLDVLKIQYTDEEKPVYAMCNFEQGALCDVEQIVSKYWYLGLLKEKFAYFRYALKNWNMTEAEKTQYIATCDGCSKCFVPLEFKNENQRWWHAFVPRTGKKILDTYVDKSKIINEDCGVLVSLPMTYSNLSVATSVFGPRNNDCSGSLWIKMFPSRLSMTQFISDGISQRYQKVEDERGNAVIAQGREFIIQFPNNQEEKEEKNVSEQFSYIDNEKYKKASCRVSLLPQQVIVYG